MYRQVSRRGGWTTSSLKREAKLSAVSQSISQDENSSRHTFRADEGALEIPQVRCCEGIDYGIDPRQVKEGCWQYRIFFEKPSLNSRDQIGTRGS